MFTFNEKTDVGRSRGTLAGVGVDFFRPESESLKIYRHRRPGAYLLSLTGQETLGQNDQACGRIRE